VTVEHPSTASSTPETADHALEEELQAEHGLARAIIISVLVAVPINVGVWVGLIAFAVSRSGVGFGGTDRDGGRRRRALRSVLRQLGGVRGEDAPVRRAGPEG
jgi:hypothetical protein